MAASFEGLFVGLLLPAAKHGLPFDNASAFVDGLAERWASISASLAAASTGGASEGCILGV